MKVSLSKDLLNSNKIMFHYGKMMEDIAKGKKDFPPVAIEIHPTSKCNHICIHCSYKERNEHRISLEKKVMEDLVKSIIKMGIRAVYFSGGGEPTMYPDLKDYITTLYENNVESSIITNGSYFEQAGLVDIANKLNYIAVSVPGVDMDTFQKITGSKNLDKVLELPGKIKEVHGEKSPIVGARIIITNINYTSIKEFLKIMKEKKFDYALFKIVRDYEDNGQGLNEEQENFIKQSIEELGEIDQDFTNLHSIFNYRRPPEFRRNCWSNTYGMIANVSMDGKVYPNIVEIDQENFCIGDLHQVRLEDMWNSRQHDVVKDRSNEKWQMGKCKNCRAISYNSIINDMMDKLPTEYDPFI